MSAIVRRPEFKRKRHNKRRARQRWPVERFWRQFSQLYDSRPGMGYITNLFPVRTPLLDEIRRKQRGGAKLWKVVTAL